LRNFVKKSALMRFANLNLECLNFQKSSSFSSILVSGAYNFCLCVVFYRKLSCLYFPVMIMLVGWLYIIVEFKKDNNKNSWNDLSFNRMPSPLQDILFVETLMMILISSSLQLQGYLTIESARIIVVWYSGISLFCEIIESGFTGAI
jgi:hypothetical protein